MSTKLVCGCCRERRPSGGEGGAVLGLVRDIVLVGTSGRAPSHSSCGGHPPDHSRSYRGACLIAVVGLRDRGW